MKKFNNNILFISNSIIYLLARKNGKWRNGACHDWLLHISSFELVVRPSWKIVSEVSVAQEWHLNLLQYFI